MTLPPGAARWSKSLQIWWDLGPRWPVDVRWLGSDHAAGHVVGLPSLDAASRLLQLPDDPEGARRLSWRDHA